MRIVFITIGLAIVACGDPHEKRVQMVMEGGEGREEMLMELLLGKGEVLPAVLPRLTDSAQPLPGRLALVDLVWKLYVRESDPRILTSLLGLLDDSAPEMRQSVVHALGNIGKEELVRPLLDQLQREAEQAVQLEILKAIEILDEWKVEGNWNFKIYGGTPFRPQTATASSACCKRFAPKPQSTRWSTSPRSFWRRWPVNWRVRPKRKWSAPIWRGH